METTLGIEQEARDRACGKNRNGESDVKSWEAVKADTHRLYGCFAWKWLIRGMVGSRTFRVILTMRLCQYAARSRGPLRFALPLFKVLHRVTTYGAAVDFPWQTEIGAGLFLRHGWGLVVNTGVRIGKNVTLFHGVTLGQRDRISRDGIRMKEYPMLEDEVWVGPNAIIVGGVTIGRGSRIAGGAFVSESVPPYSVVLGNPAVIAKSGCVPDVVNPAPLRDGLQ